VKRLAAALGLVVALVPATSAGANRNLPVAKGKTKTYVSCGSRGAHADAFCIAGAHPVAVLRARDRSRVAYRVCTRKRGAKKHCADRRSHGAGEPSRTRFDVDGPGIYKIAWFARGHSVDRDKLVVRDRSVISVGDSLGEGTRPYLPKALPDWSVSQSVSISRHAPDGLSILRKRSGLPSVIVFALGTNDDPGSSGSFRNTLQSVLALAGHTRCVVVPNIVRPPVGGSSYSGYNDAIHDLDRSAPNFREVDWAGLVARNHAWLANDGVHVNATGYQARAKLIARQVERC
jgi:lysophospholipase L1-like esterase